MSPIAVRRPVDSRNASLWCQEATQTDENDPAFFSAMRTRPPYGLHSADHVYSSFRKFRAAELMMAVESYSCAAGVVHGVNRVPEPRQLPVSSDNAIVFGMVKSFESSFQSRAATSGEPPAVRAGTRSNT